ncbi:unnamed protein product [Mytilus edulis]|uniref:Uncharacterized protein n=1 Tax=Mytilus edulis TaxID=6550 RepID=A0A8S3PR07_MYTED|nr:unnamed protein product [Mytilus edulis]
MYKDAAACTCFISALKEDTCYEELKRRIESTNVTTVDKIHLQIGIQKYVDTENVIQGTYKGASPLVIASQNGDLKIVEKLLQYDCNINSGMSPLYLASQNGHFHVVCKLIEAEANLNTSDLDGKTALFKACQNGHLNIVSKLLEFKADANLCMKTTLHQ